MDAGQAAVPMAPVALAAPAHSGAQSPRAAPVADSPRGPVAPFASSLRARTTPFNASPRAQASSYLGAPLQAQYTPRRQGFSPRVMVSSGVRSPRASATPFAGPARAAPASALAQASPALRPASAQMRASPAAAPAQAHTPAGATPVAASARAAPVRAAQAAATPRAQKLRRDNRNQNHQNQSSTECRVHVTGFPPYTQPQDLTRVFAQFGAVRVDKFTNKFAFLLFSAPEEAAAALQTTKKVNIYGEFLTVKKYDNSQLAESKPPKKTPVDMFPMSRQKGVIVEPKQIELSGSFEEQLERVLGTVRLTQEEAAAVGRLYADLERVLQPQWPGCVAMPFGSITTGLGIKTSDADCFVYIPEKFQNANVGANFVQRAKRILSTYPNLFAELLSIPRANTPIVKFFHIPTETNCDLSFKTLLGAQNSKLISFLLRTDPRLIPMAVLIKYWAKVHGFSGTGKLTNYALTMMIIFYLQQPPISILPSVESLQRDPTNDVLVDYWNTGFMDQRLLPPSMNTSSISELLGGFFEYYAKFNFQEMVICPYLGTPIKKEAFDDLLKLPDEFQRYKYNVRNALVMPIRIGTPICVQDPYEQSHNVASAINSKLASEIDAYFKFAAEAYDKEKLNNCEQFLRIILLKKPKIVTIKYNPEFRVNLFPKHIYNIVDPNWKAIVKHILCTIFEKMMKLTLMKTGEKTSPAGKEKERYTTTLTKAIWKRKQFNRLYSVMELDFQQKQAKITDEILHVEKLVFDVQFQVTMVYAYDPNSAVVTIKLTKGQTDLFKEFGRFFVSVMLNWFLVMVKPFTKPSATDAAARLQESILLNGQPEPNADLDSDDDESGYEPVENGKKPSSGDNLLKNSDTGRNSSDNNSNEPHSSDDGPDGNNDDRPDSSDNGPKSGDNYTEMGRSETRAKNNDINIESTSNVGTEANT